MTKSCLSSCLVASTPFRVEATESEIAITVKDVLVSLEPIGDVGLTGQEYRLLGGRR